MGQLEFELGVHRNAPGLNGPVAGIDMLSLALLDTKVVVERVVQHGVVALTYAGHQTPVEILVDSKSMHESWVGRQVAHIALKEVANSHFLPASHIAQPHNYWANQALLPPHVSSQSSTWNPGVDSIACTNAGVLR
mgnify:CR=1 FL=1